MLLGVGYSYSYTEMAALSTLKGKPFKVAYEFLQDGSWQASDTNGEDLDFNETRSLNLIKGQVPVEFQIKLMDDRLRIVSSQLERECALKIASFALNMGWITDGKTNVNYSIEFSRIHDADVVEPPSVSKELGNSLTNVVCALAQQFWTQGSSVLKNDTGMSSFAYKTFKEQKFAEFDEAVFVKGINRVMHWIDIRIILYFLDYKNVARIGTIYPVVPIVPFDRLRERIPAMPAGTAKVAACFEACKVLCNAPSRVLLNGKFDYTAIYRAMESVKRDPLRYHIHVKFLTNGAIQNRLKVDMSPFCGRLGSFVNTCAKGASLAKSSTFSDAGVAYYKSCPDYDANLSNLIAAFNSNMVEKQGRKASDYITELTDFQQLDAGFEELFSMENTSRLMMTAEDFSDSILDISNAGSPIKVPASLGQTPVRVNASKRKRDGRVSEANEIRASASRLLDQAEQIEREADGVATDMDDDL